ncbi:MAG TPA: hypothetical protein VK420_06585 [Longimicrobium sp.]|nr:hypothetical protein [Longimicrobium sp.]
MAEQQTQPQQSPQAEAAPGSRKRRTAYPWWKSKVVVTLLGTLAAAVAPVTVGVQSYIQKQKELAIAEREQEFKIRLAYLDLAIDPARTPADRAIVLRFLKEATHDDALSGWAGNELGLVNQELDRLKQELAKAQEALAAQEKAEREARAEVERLKQLNDANEKKRHLAEVALTEAEARTAYRAAEAAQIRDQVEPGATTKVAASPEEGSRPVFRVPLSVLPPAARAVSGRRCAPGTVKARPSLGISPEAANRACEQSFEQERPEMLPRPGGLVWATKGTGGVGEVICVCAPSGP